MNMNITDARDIYNIRPELYRQINIFATKLETMQVLEKKVPYSEIEKIMTEMMHRGIKDCSYMTKSELKQIMESLDMLHYYNDHVEILCRIKGTPFPKFTEKEKQFILDSIQHILEK